MQLNDVRRVLYRATSKDRKAHQLYPQKALTCARTHKNIGIIVAYSTKNGNFARIMSLHEQLDLSLK